MIKYFGKAFKVTNENIILTTPLVLFLFLLSIYLGVAKNAPETLPAVILLLITIWCMLSAFFSGWFFMVKKAIELDKQEFIIDEDKAKASFNLIKDFPVGIGEYFFPFLGGLILYLILIAILSFAAYEIGIHFIGKTGVSLLQFKSSLDSPAAMKALVASLTPEQLVKLNAWNFLILSSMIVFSFITLFWCPQIVIKNKNPLTSFFQALSFTFKNFLPSVILFVYISFINTIVSLINAVSTINPILYFISMLIYFYFVVYVVVLIFLYYDGENNPKTENNCSCGTDSVGENGICNPQSLDE